MPLSGYVPLLAMSTYLDAWRLVATRLHIDGYVWAGLKYLVAGCGMFPLWYIYRER